MVDRYGHHVDSYGRHTGVGFYEGNVVGNPLPYDTTYRGPRGASFGRPIKIVDGGEVVKEVFG